MKEFLDTWKVFMTEHKDDVNAGGGILLFSSDGKVLLNKRGENVSEPGTIGTIGGHLTRGEPPSTGAKREFYEEAGFKGPFQNMDLLYIQTTGNFTYYSFIASTTQTGFDFKPFEEFSHEIVWTRWLDFEELVENPSNLHPGLKDLFANSFVVKKIRKFISDL